MIPDERPLVSVCMPCFNAEAHVGAAIDSLLKQIWQPLEIIAVNDGSTDGTGAVLDRYQREHGIRVIHQQNAGQCAAANRAYRESTGQLIKFFDADDLLSPELIERQVERLKDAPGCVASAEWARFYTDPSEARFVPEAVWKDLAPMDWLVQSVVGGANMMQCALWLIPRPVLEKSGPWDERLSLINDLEFIPRVLLASEGVRFTPQARLYYRSGVAGCLSGRKSRKAYESAVNAIEGFCKTVLTVESSARTHAMCADISQLYYYEISPWHQDLGDRLKGLVVKCGGSKLKPPGGPVFETLSRFVGWRTASRLRHVAKFYGYQRQKRPTA